MTLQVRIENAHPECRDSRKVKVTHEYLSGGVWMPSKVEPTILGTAELLQGVYVHSTCRLVITETDTAVK